MKTEKNPDAPYHEKLIPTADNLKKLDKTFSKAREEGMKKFKQGRQSQFVEVKD